MKDLTISLDDTIYRRVRMIAAERNISVSALVEQLVTELSGGDSSAERLKQKEHVLRERISTFQASGHVSRDDLDDA